MDEIRLVSINGFLGYGYSYQSLLAGMENSPHMLGGDAGSTDPGPYYLGSGQQAVEPSQVYRDLKMALISACSAKVPLIIGSAGTAGGAPHVDSTIEIVRRIASEENLHFKLATIHAELSKNLLVQGLAGGRTRPMPGVPSLTKKNIDRSTRLVGQMGTGPFIQALEEGADVIIAGRACDTAIYASLPIKEGFDPGLAFHLAKIMECGSLCAIPAAASDCLLGILRKDHFLIRPLNRNREVTPHSVAAHSLYEQPNPTAFEEPEGTVDISSSDYKQVDPHTVKVSGSKFIPCQGNHTVKVEGAGLVGHRAMTVAGVRDPLVIANLDTIEGQVRDVVCRNLGGEIAADSYSLQFRYYGRDAVLGSLEPNREHGTHEVGLVIEVVAQQPSLAKAVLALARSSFLHCHFPGRKTTAGNLAFPFSPSDIDAGPVYEFTVYHLLEVEDDLELFPIEYQEI